LSGCLLAAHFGTFCVAGASNLATSFRQ
jgi:hypothetical protein